MSLDHATMEPGHFKAYPPHLKTTAALRIVRRHLPISRSTFYREIEDGTIRTSKLRGRILIRWEEIQRYIHKCQEQQA